MRIVFFGTPPFAAETLSYLVEQGVDVAAVVTKPDKPRGRSGKLQPSAVKAWAAQHLPEVPLYQPKRISSPEEAEKLRQYDADFFVVVAFGEIIKQNLLDMPKIECVNVHASLLPFYRGAAPIQRAVMAGEAKTGVTIMKMVLEMDAGAILSVAEVPISPEITSGDLEWELCQAGRVALYKTLCDLLKGSVVPIEQDHSQATHAAKITVEDCRVRWGETSDQVHNRIRGVSPRPGAWSVLEIDGVPRRAKVAETHVVEMATLQPGEVGRRDGYPMVVGCGRGAVAIGRIQPEGKKMMDVTDFLKGQQGKQMTFLETDS